MGVVHRVGVSLQIYQQMVEANEIVRSDENNIILAEVSLAGCHISNIVQIALISPPFSFLRWKKMWKSSGEYKTVSPCRVCMQRAVGQCVFCIHKLHPAVSLPEAINLGLSGRVCVCACVVIAVMRVR